MQLVYLRAGQVMLISILPMSPTSRCGASTSGASRKTSTIPLPASQPSRCAIPMSSPWWQLLPRCHLSTRPMAGADWARLDMNQNQCGCSGLYRRSVWEPSRGVAADHEAVGVSDFVGRNLLNAPPSHGDGMAADVVAEARAGATVSS